MSSRIFLLSPANCKGRRAQQVMSPKAAFSLAMRLRSEDGAPIGEIFAHVSGLYFRGKLTYANRFGRAFVITPDCGLVPAETTVTFDVLRRFSGAEISLDNPRYRVPLERTTEQLLAQSTAADFVLLGSVASQKYVEILGEVLGSRLTFPSAFVGRGDMSRGGLLLRAAAAGEELEYVPVLGSVRRGSRPPKLAPLVRL